MALNCDLLYVLHQVTTTFSFTYTYEGPQWVFRDPGFPLFEARDSEF